MGQHIFTKFAQTLWLAGGGEVWAPGVPLIAIRSDQISRAINVVTGSKSLTKSL
jgi:hypothetical protein